MIWSWRRFFLHFPVGFMLGICPMTLALGIIVLFALYEVTEDWRIRDKAFIDIQGALGGVMVVAVLRWGLALSGVDLAQLGG